MIARLLLVFCGLVSASNHTNASGSTGAVLPSTAAPTTTPASGNGTDSGGTATDGSTATDPPASGNTTSTAWTAEAKVGVGLVLGNTTVSDLTSAVSSTVKTTVAGALVHVVLPNTFAVATSVASTAVTTKSVVAGSRRALEETQSRRLTTTNLDVTFEVTLDPTEMAAFSTAAAAVTADSFDTAFKAEAAKSTVVADAGITFDKTVFTAPAVTFKDASGTAKTLADLQTAAGVTPDPGTPSGAFSSFGYSLIAVGLAALSLF